MQRIISSLIPAPVSFSSSCVRLFRTSSPMSEQVKTPFKAKNQIIKLSNLSDMPGARIKTIRVGRGPSSQYGKTCGKGQKGTFQHRALHKVGFEGGQTPMFRRMPKRGFNNPFAKELDILNLNRLTTFIDEGRIDASQVITIKTLFDSRVVGKIKHGVKLLGDGAGKLKFPIHVEVSDISKSAKEAIEAAGGSVKLIHLNRVGLRAHLKPEKFERLPKNNGIPPPKTLQKYLPYLGADKTTHSVISHLA